MWIPDPIRPFVYHITIFGILLLQLSGLTRYYLIQEDRWKYSYWCLFHTVLFVSADLPIFWALTMTRYTNPGHVIPTEDEISKLKSPQADGF